MTGLDQNLMEWEDWYSEEKCRKQPLLLDQVMEGGRRPSDSSFLGLPSEVLADIVHLLADDPAALAAIALVNSDCRQLARTAQFVETRISCSEHSEAVVRSLGNEVHGKGNGERKPSIGSCIRKIVFKANARTGRLAFDLHERYGNPIRDATKAYDKIPLQELLTAISHAMPHLEVIDWQEALVLNTEFFEAIKCSRIHQLKLYRCIIPHGSVITLPDSMPLRSLRLKILQLPQTDSDSMESSVSALLSQLFRRCAPSLERLEWEGMEGIGEGVTVSFGDESIDFPSLRYLQLLPADHLDLPALKSLLRPQLKGLSLPGVCWNKMNQGLWDQGPFRDLEELEVGPLNPETIGPFFDKFLHKHTHIQKLRIWFSDVKILNFRLRPLLCPDKFTKLRSLSLSWAAFKHYHGGSDPVFVPEEALAAIGMLTSLEQLCLSAGDPGGWQVEWLIDHDTVRRHLNGLTRLKRLALCGDTYARGLSPELAPQYYFVKPLAPDVVAAARTRPDLDAVASGLDRSDDWHRGHRNLILEEVEKYAAEMPGLEWMYCGQLSIAITDGKPGGPKVAVPLSSWTRNEYYPLIGRMFGMDC